MLETKNIISFTYLNQRVEICMFPALLKTRSDRTLMANIRNYLLAASKGAEIVFYHSESNILTESSFLPIRRRNN